MNKRVIVAGMLFAALVNSGCHSFVARKDSSQIVKFKDMELNRCQNVVNLYRINYPTTTKEYDNFYNEFQTLLSKMAAHNEKINIVIPKELYQDMNRLKNRDIYGSEQAFKKYSYLLTDEEKELIDKKVDVRYPKNVGSIQEYLNKQVAYLYDYIGEKSKYNENIFYTELDKEKILDSIIDKKKDVVDLFFMLEDNFAVESDSNVDTKLPIYLTGELTTKEQLEELKNNIIISDGKVEDMVVPGKILLINGKTTKNIKDHRIKTHVTDVDTPLTLVKTLGEDRGLKLKDMDNFEIIKVQWGIAK